MHRTVVAVHLGLLVSCASFSEPGHAQVSQLALNEPGQTGIFLPVCDRGLPDGVFPYCQERLNALYHALVASKVFRQVEIGVDMAADGDYVVDLYDFPVRPYWATPAHNPAFALLSFGIPFWWDEPGGFYFSVRQLPDGPILVVDTRWSGTSVMWGLASLMNILPGRTFRSRYQQDVNRLQLAFGSARR